MTLHSSDCSKSSVGHAGEDHIEGVVVGRISSTYVPIGRLSCRLKMVFLFFFFATLGAYLCGGLLSARPSQQVPAGGLSR